MLLYRNIRQLSQQSIGKSTNICGIHGCADRHLLKKRRLFSRSAYQNLRKAANSVRFFKKAPLQAPLEGKRSTAARSNPSAI